MPPEHEHDWKVLSEPLFEMEERAFPLQPSEWLVPPPQKNCLCLHFRIAIK